jgi:hypothetical protein
MRASLGRLRCRRSRSGNPGHSPLQSPEGSKRRLCHATQADSDPHAPVVLPACERALEAQGPTQRTPCSAIPTTPPASTPASIRPASGAREDSLLEVEAVDEERREERAKARHADRVRRPLSRNRLPGGGARPQARRASRRPSASPLPRRTPGLRTGSDRPRTRASAREGSFRPSSGLVVPSSRARRRHDRDRSGRDDGKHSRGIAHARDATPIRSPRRTPGR